MSIELKFSICCNKQFPKWNIDQLLQQPRIAGGLILNNKERWFSVVVRFQLVYKTFADLRTDRETERQTHRYRDRQTNCNNFFIFLFQDISTGSTIFTVTASDEDTPDPPGNDLLTYKIEEGNVVSAIKYRNILSNMYRELQQGHKVCVSGTPYLRQYVQPLFKFQNFSFSTRTSFPRPYIHKRA